MTRGTLTCWGNVLVICWSISQVDRGPSWSFFNLCIFWSLFGQQSGFGQISLGPGPAKTWFGFDGLAKQELTQLLLFISGIGGPKDPKSLNLHLFFHAWTFELSSTNPLWLCLSWSFSNQCPQLAWGPEERVPLSRRNEIRQIDPNWTEPKKGETLRMIFSPFLVSGQLFGPLTSQSLLANVGIFHFQSQKRRMKGFLVSNFQMGSLRNCQGKGVRCHKS